MMAACASNGTSRPRRQGRYLRIASGILAVLLVSPAGAGGLTQNPEAGQDPMPTAGNVSIPTNLGSSEIKGWYAPNSRTLIVNTYKHGEYRATFSSPCNGIRSASSIGFSTQGTIELDSSTTVVLPDGTHCVVKRLNSYSNGPGN